MQSVISYRLSEQEKAVADYLQEQNIQYAARYIGEVRSPWESEKPVNVDMWQVSFINAVKHLESTTFYTGIGLRKPVKNAPKKPASSIGMPYTLEQLIANWEIAYVKPAMPCAASVLYGLLSDMQALDTSFEYWCSDYGYDADSMRAFKTYQACCDTGKQMRKIFTNEQIRKLRELLEDY